MRRLDVAVTAAWAAGLALALAGDDPVRWTVRVSLAYWLAAVVLMIRLGPADWAARTPTGRLSRLLWTGGWVAFAVHVLCAFHYVDHWSHAAAIERTARASGFGRGVYVSHLFTVVWLCDALYWWLSSSGYATRPAWLGRLLHGFMLFIVFNGTVVYETGPVRYAGAAAFAVLAALGWRAYRAWRPQK